MSIGPDHDPPIQISRWPKVPGSKVAIDYGAGQNTPQEACSGGQMPLGRVERRLNVDQHP